MTWVELLTGAFSKLWVYVAGIAAAIAGFFLIKRMGADEQKAKQHLSDLEEYKDTRKDIDERIEGIPDDRDAVLDRMRDRIRQRKSGGV